MALTAHKGLHAAAVSAAQIRTAVTVTASASDAFEHTYASVEAAVEATAAQLWTLTSATVGMSKGISTCIAQTEALAVTTSGAQNRLTCHTNMLCSILLAHATRPLL